VRLSPVLTATGTYPFVRLTEAKRRVADRGIELLDFGVGEPREETPAFIRRALAAAVEAEPVSAYPLAEGLPELRAAAARWVGGGSASRSTRRPRSCPRSGRRRPCSASRRSSTARSP
jgi:acetylornithine aminotransferase